MQWKIQYFFYAKINPQLLRKGVSFEEKLTIQKTK